MPTETNAAEGTMALSTPGGIGSPASFDGSAISHNDDPSAFARWHFRRKAEVMRRLFQKYVEPRSTFADMACGDGDALVLVSSLRRDAELWGIDLDRAGIDRAARRVPDAHVICGDVLASKELPRDYFDVVHEFGASFLIDDWSKLVSTYFSLVRPGGVILWELPERWSSAHISYLLSLAPRADDSALGRIIRSLNPSKYRFRNERTLTDALDASGNRYEILERVPIWHFYCRGPFCAAFDFAWRPCGDRLFDFMDAALGQVWPWSAGYYLVVRKTGNR